MESLTEEEVARYSRQTRLPEFGSQGQVKLRNAKVLVVGAGGLGSPALFYLAAAGVGTLGVAEGDTVDVTNLQRQILFQTSDIGKKKAEVARQRLQALNPNIDVQSHPERVDSSNVNEIVSGYEIVLDGTDNHESRYLIHDACYETRRDYIYAAVYRNEGQLSVFSRQPGTPCYRCVYPSAPEFTADCSEAGVLGVLPGVMGVLQATEALKRITGLGESLVGRLLTYDARTLLFRVLQLRANPSCPLCGEKPTATRVDPVSIEARALLKKIENREEFRLIDVREDLETAAGLIPQAIHIPMSRLPERLAELDRNAEIVVYCQRGIRSITATRLMKKQGFKHVSHLAGGIASIPSEALTAAKPGHSRRLCVTA